MPENVLVNWRLSCCLVNWLFCQTEMNRRKKDQFTGTTGPPCFLLGSWVSRHSTSILSSQGKWCLTQMTEMHRKPNPHYFLEYFPRVKHCRRNAGLILMRHTRKREENTSWILACLYMQLSGGDFEEREAKSHKSLLTFPFRESLILSNGC